MDWEDAASFAIASYNSLRSGCKKLSFVILPCPWVCGTSYGCSVPGCKEQLRIDAAAGRENARLPSQPWLWDTPSFMHLSTSLTSSTARHAFLQGNGWWGAEGKEKHVWKLRLECPARHCSSIIGQQAAGWGPKVLEHGGHLQRHRRGMMRVKKLMNRYAFWFTRNSIFLRVEFHFFHSIITSDKISKNRPYVWACHYLIPLFILPVCMWNTDLGFLTRRNPHLQGSADFHY